MATAALTSSSMVVSRAFRGCSPAQPGSVARCSFVAVPSRAGTCACRRAGHPTPMAFPRVVVVGSGFAGWHAVRQLRRRLPQGAELTLVSATDYLLYTPLLPAVATGVLSPRSVAVPLAQSLAGAELMLRTALSVDVDRRQVEVQDAAGQREQLSYDRLVLAPGSVTRQMPVPGLAERGYGLKTLPQALALRDHVFQQLDLADAERDAARRRARSTFVVVGAGYAGTELAAQMKGVIDAHRARWHRLGSDDVRWLLVDASETVMPELGDALGKASLDVLRRRGVDVRMATTVDEVGPDAVTLSTGEQVATHTVVWCAGVEPGPLAAATGLPLQKGRLATSEDLRVDGRDDVFAVGDAASVPDRTREGKPCPPTAQHAQRQGAQVARTVAASLAGAPLEPYEHRDLGLVVDLGRRDGVARPLGVPLKGLPAKAVTLGYHLAAVPTLTGRVRVAAELLLAAALPTQTVQLSPLPEGQGTLSTEIGAPQPT